MGSFAGVSIDAKNLEQAVSLAEQKKILAEQNLKNTSFEQVRSEVLAQTLLDYRQDQLDSKFPDGEYYVTADFNSQLVLFQGDAYNPNQLFTGLPPVIKQFKKGELVKVGTFIKDMAMTKVKVIETDSGNFFADQNNLSKTKPAEPFVTESKEEIKQRNEDNTKIMIGIAFILGYLLSKD
jgi:hypothetical protein